jgi:gliding motility-associated-like protein
MRTPFYIISLVFLSLSHIVEAQTAINTSISARCDSLVVQFSYTTTTFPINSIWWNFGRSVNDTSTKAVPGPIAYAPGLYTVSLVLNNNTDTARILVGRPSFFFTYRTEFDYGYYTVIFQSAIVTNTRTVSPPYNYKWDIQGRTLVNPDSSFLIHRFDSIGIYRARLIVTDNLGCTDTVIRPVVIRDTLIVPTVFTPNDDSYNDELKIPTNGKTIFSFKVFSRNGIMVYKTESKILSWDGRLSSGDKALPGIYFYIIETLDLTPAMKKAGFFYIYR